MLQHTQIAVIGAGHAGIEAALAAARLGCDCVLFTISLDAVANMPCNPSIGGSGKGHLVYEIDALGGEMGRAADAVTLQSRTLNLGKGAAVHSKRVQADRMKYRELMKRTLETQENLHLVQAEITEIRIIEENGEKRVASVVTKLGEIWECGAVVICTGTYLESTIFVGDVSYEAGPDGMLSSKGLSASLLSLGIKLMRFKTGTPARVNRRSIDMSELDVQNGEEDAMPYSVYTDEHYLAGKEQLTCHIVYTNERTHEIIRQNITRSAMYSGKIHGTGPRYCPSIEDKITRFADKPRHQLFIEPLGENTDEMYIQGFSTSLPTDVQVEMLHSLKGFANAEIMRYAYAIEYDCCDPLQLYPTLEFMKIPGLYGAGQFNGTSGYEEAAAQGLVAGINAALKFKGEPPLLLERYDGYIGTLIDDLVTKGTAEPYRIMTSRSEYRLLLRQDNADERLTPKGYAAGLISEERFRDFTTKQAAKEDLKKRLENTFVSPAQANEFLTSVGEQEITSGVSFANLLRRPAVEFANLKKYFTDTMPTATEAVERCAEIEIKYKGYIEKQLSAVGRARKTENTRLPSDIDYSLIAGLRIEARQKLQAIRPMTVGQAAGISGVNPADITVLLIYLGLD